jgi:hypothetical protein
LQAVKKYHSSKIDTTESEKTIDQLIALTNYKERSDNVVKLQDELKDLGFLSKDIDSTGYYGDLTLQAVKKYRSSKSNENIFNNQELYSMNRDQLINILINLIKTLQAQGKLKI